MQPTLAPGDRLLAVRGRRAVPGDLVVVPDPRQPTRPVVKRVVGVASPDGEVLILRGDNPEGGTDSREFGGVAAAMVRGRVVYRYAPPHRRGRVPPLVP